MKEFIICAAIHLDDGYYHAEVPEGIKTGFVICGRRHSDCYSLITHMCSLMNMAHKVDYYQKLITRKHQGFMTSTNRYVGKKEAYEIAEYNNQIQWGGKAIDKDDMQLISENLY